MLLESRTRTQVALTAGVLSSLALVCVRRARLRRGARSSCRERWSYVVVGDAFVDVLARGVKELPAWNSDSLTADPIELKSGGSAMNTAIHLREASGEEVVLHSAVGGDDFGDFLRTAAQERGVRLVDHGDRRRYTGSCIVISGDRDRTFVTYRGAVDYMRGNSIKLDEGCDHVHLAGFYNCAGLQDDAAGLFRRARRAGATTSLGVQHDASGLWERVGRRPLTTDDAAPDFVILSEDEAHQIVAQLVPFDQKPQSWPRADALALLAAGAARCVVLTVGAKGAILATHDGQHAIVLDQPAAQVDAFVDATGAGDAFAAGFVHGLKSTRGSLRAALKLGCAAGATCVANKGASQALNKALLQTHLAYLDTLPDQTDLYFQDGLARRGPCTL